MSYFAHTPDGRIVQTMDGPVKDVLLACEFSGMGCVLADPAAEEHTHYVKDGRVVVRPENPAVLEASVLRDIPVAGMLLINGEAFPIDAPTVELDFTAIGHYEIKLVCWPYMDKTFEVSV